MNLHRRHLNESQRQMVAARIANMPHGGDRKSDQSPNLDLDRSADHAAKMLNVSRAGVFQAKHVLQEAAPEVVQAVDAGHSLRIAYQP